MGREFGGRSLGRRSFHNGRAGGWARLRWDGWIGNGSRRRFPTNTRRCFRHFNRCADGRGLNWEARRWRFRYLNVSARCCFDRETWRCLRRFDKLNSTGFL